MTETANHPERPDHIVLEGKESCIRNGRQLNWSNCTPAGVAMAISIATLHDKNPSACSVRIVTGDTVGGTTLNQCCAAAKAEWGVTFEIRVGSNVASAYYVALKLRAGCSANLQGNGDALIMARTVDGVSVRSTKGAVNHNVIAVEGRGWHQDSSGRWFPSEVLVYDPAADGRSVAWGSGHAAKGPQWWRWSTVLAFCAALRPSSPDGGRTGNRIGANRIYCAFGPDTLPHVHMRFNPGTSKTVPFPRHMVAAPLTSGRRVGVRTGPSTRFPRAIKNGAQESLAKGDPFVAYQRHIGTAGEWFGDHPGKRWVPANRMR